MKNLILISGTMGVGKTTTCRALQKILPNNVFLDGDWCWEMQPFVVNDATRTMVLENIRFLLSQFLKCPQYENVIFCWVMDEQSILDAVLSGLDTTGCRVHAFSLVAREEALIERLERDVKSGVRQPDIIGRSVARLEKYQRLDTQKIEVSNCTCQQAAQAIAARL